MGAGVWRPSAVAETGYPRVRRGGGERADELAPGLPADFLVSLNVYVDGEDGHRLSHNEGEGAEVERPAVGVGVLFVVVAFVVGVSCVAGDVNNDANDVAQTWWNGKEEKDEEAEKKTPVTDQSQLQWWNLKNPTM